nr:MAG TPA: hypothetical protein [Caudoviricetes sp.]
MQTGGTGAIRTSAPTDKGDRRRHRGPPGTSTPPEDPSASLRSPHHPTTDGDLVPRRTARPIPRPRPVGAMTPNQEIYR